MRLSALLLTFVIALGLTSPLAAKTKHKAPKAAHHSATHKAPKVPKVKKVKPMKHSKPKRVSKARRIKPAKAHKPKATKQV